MADLNNKQRATLQAIFEAPTRSDIPWKKVEALFEALGGVVTQGNGSRVHVELRGEMATFHTPHPGRVTNKGAVKSVRQFLINAGVDPQ